MICPNCHNQMIIRQGKRGQFMGCSNYPKCKETSQMTRREEQLQDDIAQGLTEYVFEIEHKRKLPHDSEARHRRIEYAIVDLEILANLGGPAEGVLRKAIEQRRELLK